MARAAEAGAAGGGGTGGGRDPAVDVLRAAAMALIVNSHLDGFYPAGRLATGGALGNALFFFLSGYGLAGPGRAAAAGFGSWYLRRACRLYPALVIAVALFGALPEGAWRHWGPREWAGAFLWPTQYWFVGALMIFYAAFHPLRRAGRPGLYLAALAALAVPYLAWYFGGLDLGGYVIEGEGRFKWIHYFQVMLFGAWVASRPRLAEGGGWRDGAGLAVAALGYGGLLALVAGGRAGALQGLTHLLVYPMLLAALRLARAACAPGGALSAGAVRAAAAFVAGITLELYLVQGPVRGLALVQGQGFPLNLALYGALLVPGAWLLHRGARLLARAAGCGA